MAYIPQLINKGMCISCGGTGWEPEIKREVPRRKYKREKPNQFDLGKCPVCNGSGVNYEMV